VIDHIIIMMVDPLVILGLLTVVYALILQYECANEVCEPEGGISEWGISEETSDDLLDPTLPFIVRCDGHCFSKFTKGMDKPFDIRFTRAMKNTLESTMNAFHARTGYCHSDELSLLFAPVSVLTESHIFGGRVDKIITNISSYVSVQFNYFLQQEMKDVDPSSSVYKKVFGMKAHFDGRAIVPHNSDEIYEYFLNREKDCFRNCVSAYARANSAGKSIDGKCVAEMMKMLDTQGISIPLELQKGTYIKKTIVRSTAYNPKTRKNVECIRSKFFEICLENLYMMDPEDFACWTCSKYVAEKQPVSCKCVLVK